MMAQFHPSASATTFLDSFQFSLAARLHFSTYASSIRITHKRFRYSINSQRSADERGRSVVSVSNPRCELSSKWIGKWDEANRNYRPKQPPTVLNYRAAGNVSCSAAAGGGGSTMDRIVEKLKRFGYMDGGVDGGKETTAVQRVVEKGPVEDCKGANLLNLNFTPVYIEQIGSTNSRGNADLYDRFDYAYSSEDEGGEEEGDEAFLETYDDNETDGEEGGQINTDDDLYFDKETHPFAASLPLLDTSDGQCI